MGAAEFAVLPAVGPAVTAVAVLAAQVPALAALWQNPAPAAIVDAVVQVRSTSPAILLRDLTCLIRGSAGSFAVSPRGLLKDAHHQHKSS